LIDLLPHLGTATDEEATPQESQSAREIRGYLVAGQFDELDLMAGRLRSSKARVAGGGWKLRVFYAALDQRPATDQEMVEHIAHIESWMKQRPGSITAPVALAGSLETWAWMARGSGTADKVTDDGWKLFEERIKRAREVLDAAEKLQPMCPQWYSAMMTVGLAQGWDGKQMQALFEKGTAFEPEYFYLYKEYANYLQPKWEGHPGDSTAFARVSADKIGGDGGDLIYFWIATVLIKRGNGVMPTGEMDWQRIQRGEHVLETRYRATRGTTNQFAFMAYKYRDGVVAAPLFAEIGDRWTKAVWKDKETYDKARVWSQRNASVQQRQEPNDKIMRPFE